MLARQIGTLAAQIDDRDLRAVLREPQGDRLAQPAMAPRAGYDRYPSSQSHVVPPDFAFKMLPVWSGGNDRYAAFLRFMLYITACDVASPIGDLANDR